VADLDGSAIGHSTNLIGRDSNIIVIRGGSRPVYQQMTNAIDEFFPGHNLPDQDQHVPSPHRRSSSERGHGTPDLHRVDTGVSDIVGVNNGDRPGGFVLVIDGSALVSVCHSISCMEIPAERRSASRHWETRDIGRSSSTLRLSARA
jgi:hypothetical protein